MGNKKQANCNQPKPAYLSTLSRYSKKVLVSLLAELVVLQQCAWAYNDIIPPQNVNDNPINHIVIDPDRAGNAFIDRTQNGTPVININAASKGGVSANYYRDFNINSENLIWNNLQGEAGISKLGGALHGNPNFNKPDARPADIILNEITGSRVSNINGYGEVFGKKAEVIIANPNGIMVGGAGFINTSRLSLITGSSNGLDANGNLTPFTMSTSPNAIITVIGRDVVDADGNPVAYNLGIDMAGGNVMDLISRIVKINGKLLAGDEINIITGNDKATRTPDGWTVTSKDGEDKPEFAIDSTALGGIYAGRINLIANEDGVGVRTRGDVISTMDDVQFDAQGNIIIDGGINAAKNVVMHSPKDVSINGADVLAGRDISINADKITNRNALRANGDMNIRTTVLDNTGGKLVAIGDFVLDLGNQDWATNGVLQAGGTLRLMAKDLTNVNGDISAGDIVINATNFTNGSDTVATIMGATNSLSLNITGDLMNYGTLRGGRDVSINAINVVNGAVAGSNATIHAGRDMVIHAAQRILNRGFVQALGNLTLTTDAAQNEDYVLNPNAQKLATDNDTTLAPEYQSIYDALDTITDTAQLYDLLANVKTSEQFYKVQKRLQMLRIDEVLTEYGDMADGADIDNLVSLPEDEMQESLAELLGDDYDAADWTIDLSGDIANINTQISDQQQRTDDYNAATRLDALAEYEADKETARQEYADLNGGDDTGFTYPDFEYTPVSREDYATLSGEDYLDYDTMVAAAETAAKTARANKITTFIGDTTTIVNEYRTYDWSTMTDSDIADKMSLLMGDEYNPSDWIIPPFKKADALQLGYINSLRINSVNRDLVERTGIHNDGRIYSGADMGLNSNSVLHNNRGALIYSTGDMALSVENYLFNNANAAGQGILSKGTLSITSRNNGWLDHLINYDGTIESDLDLTLHATEIVNYGSDSIDLSGIDNNIYPAMEYRYHWTETKRVLGRKKKKHKSRVISEAEYNQMKAAGQNVTATYLGYNYVKDYPELQASYYLTKKHLEDQRHNATVKTDKDEAHLTLVSETSKIRSNRGTLSILTDDLVNYNSQIFGENAEITAQNILNQNLTLNINIKEYYVQRYRKCKRVAGVCVDHYQARKEWTHNIVEEYQGLSPSTIVAAKNLKINVQTLGNGTSAVDPAASGNTTLPYDPTSLPETELQEIVRTGTIDPLAGFKLPDGGYGLIRAGDILNSHYLYETDPTLIDLEHYLGSKYLMNRIGMDPDDVDAKFLGDAYVEHQMIKDALDKTQGFRNKIMTDAETEDYINGLYNTVTPELVADLGLEFGRAPTPQQIAKLDHDIVWYVKQNITLPNGETVEVLVPQVFLAQSTVDELYGAALARDDTKASIRGDNVSIDAISAEAESRLDNMGAIVGNRQLVITTDQINNSARTVGYQTPVLRGGDVLVLDTGEGGIVNNMGGRIETTNADSILAINTGELNNITLTQRETQDRGNYKRVETNIGGTATISGSGDIKISTTGDMNLTGAKIGANKDIKISVAGDITAVSVQDYEYEYQKQKYGDWYKKTTKIDEKASLKHIGSEIQAGNNLDITGNNITSIGTTFDAKNDINITAKDITLLSAKDYDMEYHYKKTERINIENIATEIATGVAGAVAVVAGTVATVGSAGALTPITAGVIAAGTGATAGAIDSTTDKDKGKKGTVKTSYDYNETLVGNEINAKNLTIKIENDLAYGNATVITADSEQAIVGGTKNIIAESEADKHLHLQRKFGRTIEDGALRGGGLGIVVGTAVMTGSFVWEALLAPAPCAVDGTCETSTESNKQDKDIATEGLGTKTDDSNTKNPVIDDPDFRAQLSYSEGNREKFYIDSTYNLSIGIGNNVQDRDSFMALELYDENGHLLSDEEKISLHAELTALTRAMKEASNGQSYNKIDNTVYSVNGRDLTVKTSQEDIQRHFNQSIQDSMNEVSIIFPDFSNYPIPAQQVLVEMNFNMGAGQFSEKNWPRLFESIRNEDWATAATECHRFQLQEERNNWARDKFLEAAGQGE